MPAKSPAPAREAWESLFSGALGLWLGLALIKFGNPVILDPKISAPTNREELIYQAWPVAWGYWLLAVVVLLALRVWRWKIEAPRWVIVLPLVWLSWQFLSATQTVDASLTAATLKHFVSCAVCFYVGLFALSGVERSAAFWLGLFGGFVVVLAVGLEQHFGGLERTRRFFYALPNWQSYPPEFLKKIASNRIFSTLVYPNALAGAILLLLPMLLATLWRLTEGRVAGVRAVLCGTAAVAGLGCLYWSGSKAGWLIALAQGAVAFLRSGLPKRIKIVAVVVVLLAGVAGFAAKYSGYFETGASSAAARLDYWRAAWTTMLDRPIFGSGPGTFVISYKSLKPPEAEMTRLAHNDYLQQGSDSGLVGLLAYAGLWFVSLIELYRRSPPAGPLFGVWLGLTGLAAQSFVEFGLYIPTLAWPAFLLLGFALGHTRIRIDKPVLGK
jgi:hypothetical protein